MEHTQSKTEKNITSMPLQAEDNPNGREQPQTLRVAMYCRVGTRKQLLEGSDEVSEIAQKLSAAHRFAGL